MVDKVEEKHQSSNKTERLAVELFPFSSDADMTYMFISVFRHGYATRVLFFLKWI